MNELDNLAWYSLNGPHLRFRRGNELGAAYDAEVSPFCALADEVTDEAWGALASVLGEGETATIFRDEVNPPSTWDTVMSLTGVQMVGPRNEEWEVDPRIRVLEPSDQPQMMALVERTQPGPFRARTHELGEFLGIFHADRLVAMAGQRFRTSTYVEISAVCTDEEVRGQGLATTLIRAHHTRLTQQGLHPMLHTAETNVRAISLYEQLGYVLRTPVAISILRPPTVTSTSV